MQIIFNKDRLCHSQPLLKNLNLLNVLSDKYVSKCKLHAQNQNWKYSQSLL